MACSRIQDILETNGSETWKELKDTKNIPDRFIPGKNK
jgi:hypothetical protein